MTNIPLVAFAAYSGTGKTTLIEKLIPILKGNGIRSAAIKHDGHPFEIDHEGKDSWRIAHAGADITVVSSSEQTAYIERRDLSFERLLGMVHDVDLILVEGYKDKALPQIGMARKGAGKGSTADISRFIALVTDLEVETELPCFALEDAEGIAVFIMEEMRAKRI